MSFYSKKPAQTQTKHTKCRKSRKITLTKRPAQFKTNLVSSLLGAEPEVGDVHRLGKTSLCRGIEHLVERDVLEDLVDSQLVWIDHHGDCLIVID